MSRKCRRGQIHAKDVLVPFLVLITINTVMLTVFTVVAPLEWTRVETSSTDRFGRSTESYGTCYEFDNTSQYVFLALQGAVNLSALLFAIYQAYKSRQLPPSNFNESRYIAISLLSLLEAFLLSVPLFFLVSESPSADFIVETVMVTIICLAILLPLFIPKYVKRNEDPHDVLESRILSLTPNDSSASRRLSSSMFSSSRRLSFLKRLSSSNIYQENGPSEGNSGSELRSPCH